MARKKKNGGNHAEPSVPCRIYSYGCLEPTVGLEKILEQMRKGNDYRNSHVRIELDRRDEYYATLSEIDPSIGELHSLTKGMQIEIRKLPRGKEKDEMIDQQKAHRDVLKLLCAKAKLADAVKARLKQLDGQNYEEIKELYNSASDVYWATRLVVDAAAKDFKKGCPPEFRRFVGEGRIAVQLQGGLPVNDVDGGTIFRIVPAGQSKGGRRKFAECWFRVGSTEKGKPEFAVIPFVYHRPLPDGANIKWAYLHRLKCGTRWTWKLSVVVSRECGWPINDAANDGVVSIDIGYKMTSEGLHVATFVASDGGQGDLVIKNDDYNRWLNSNYTKSERKKSFNDFKSYLSDWLSDRDVPDWLSESTNTIGLWKSCSRLSRLYEEWSGNRFVGDDEMFDTLKKWYYADRRAIDMEQGQSSRAIRWRDDMYRNFVSGLRRKYRKVVIRDVDYSVIATAGYMPDIARRNRFIAAPGRLVSLIVVGFAECEKVAVVKESREAEVPKPKKTGSGSRKKTRSKVAV